MSVSTTTASTRIKADAFDANNWAGIVLGDGINFVFALRFAVKSGGIVDGKDVLEHVKEVGPHAPDSSYCRLKWSAASGVLVTLEWSQTSDETVVGKIGLDEASDARLHVIPYYPWDYKGTYALSEDAIVGESSGKRFYLVTSPAPTGKDAFEEAKLLLYMQEGHPIYFTASVSGSKPACKAKEIDKQLVSAEESYLKSRVEVKGNFYGAGESITNNLNWMRMLIPHTDITYLPAGRPWVWSDWTVFEWDGFFNALEATIENRELAVSMLKALLKTQMDNGNFPNYGGESPEKTSVDRSQPQVGTYCTWKVYQRLGKPRQLLEECYPAFVKWHKWWLDDSETGKPRRDGNNDGLLEWGSDKGDMQCAKFESGMDDSPLWDGAKYQEETWTMNLNAVDCTCLYAMDAMYLSKIAAELGKEDEIKAYLAEYERLKKLINDELWNEKAGMYLDRYWDGTFSSRMGAANFYALTAGIAPEDRAKRMMETFNDPNKFWGKWMVPTISRDDEAFPDQQYWRGTIWPPTNFLVYEGLKNYGLDKEAAALAASGAEMFLAVWRKDGTCRENFNSQTGEGGGQKYQSWGPLFALCLLEEFADVDPVNGGLRFGSFITDENTVRNLCIDEDTYEVTIGKKLDVRRNGKGFLSSDGPIVISGYKAECDGLSFAVHAIEQCELSLYEDGIRTAAVDNKIKTEAADGKVVLTIEPGRHTVVCE